MTAYPISIACGSQVHGVCPGVFVRDDNGTPIQCACSCHDGPQYQPESEPEPQPARCRVCHWRGLAAASDCPSCGAVALTADTGMSARLTTAAEGAPQDGEQLGELQYSARHSAWLYPASYSELQLCDRRAASLQESYGVPFDRRVFVSGEGWYAAARRTYTAQLRAAKRA